MQLDFQKIDPSKRQDEKQSMSQKPNVINVKNVIYVKKSQISVFYLLCTFALTACAYTLTFCTFALTIRTWH